MPKSTDTDPMVEPAGEPGPRSETLSQRLGHQEGVLDISVGSRDVRAKGMGDTLGFKS